MNSIKKIWLVITLLTIAGIVLVNNVKAQTNAVNKFSLRKFSISIAPEAGIVIGNEHAFHNTEIGSTIQLQYNITDQTAITLASGYYNLLSNNAKAEDAHAGVLYQTPTGNFGIVPIKLGIKEIFGHSFYIALEAGIGKEVSGYLYYDTDLGEEYQQLKTIVSPGLGYTSKWFEVGFRYENLFPNIISSSQGPTVFGENYYYGIVSLHVTFRL